MNKNCYYFKQTFVIISLVVTTCLLCSFGNDTQKQRVRYSINKNPWKFIRTEVKNGQKPSLDVKDWLSITIPHDYNGGSDGVHNDVFTGRFDWKNDPDKRNMYKGPGWYRTEFTIEKQYQGKRIFIDFEAVSLDAKVWVNGKEVGQHRGGYTAFSFDITDFVSYGKPNILAVRADNTNTPTRAPWMNDEKRPYPFSFDYAIYGGIYRDVWITITDPVKIEKVLNTPTCGGQAPSSVNVETRVKNYSTKAAEVELTTDIFDPEGKKLSTLKSKKAIQPGQQVSFNQLETALGNVQMWEPSNPKLYKVNSTITYNGKVADEFESNFGIRYYTYANNQPFVLNGKKMLLRGVNRHQDMQGLGYALPNEQHWADAKLLKDAGFNYIRHAHYPCDQEFTKACDQMGMMLWLEIPLSGSTSDDPAFIQNCKDQLTEMIEEHYNSPAVIVWGIGNESDRSGTTEAKINSIYKELVAHANKLDPNRPVTGCNYKFESNQAIVNMYAPQNWVGWYSDRLSDYNPTTIIGEYGADAHYPNHTDEKFRVDSLYGAAQKPDFWSQEYACFVHEFKVSKGEEVKNNFPGHLAWVAFDFASPRVDRLINPIKFMNQKGLIMHDHKTKKDVYYFYQSAFRSAKDYPMVYIVSHSWTDRWKQPEKKDIWVYSNCDSVELFNDYGSLSFGKHTKTAGPRGDTRFQWDAADVKFNVLYAEGLYEGKVVARDTIVLQNLPKK